MDTSLDVFISYANPDKVVADAICHTLEEHGIKCWIAPRDVTPGTPYARAIIKAIKESHLMVMVYSRSSNQSEHVANEVDRMFNLGRPIIPFLIDETAMSDEYEYYLSRKHWLVAYPEYREKCEELAAVVLRVLNKTETSANTIATENSSGSTTDLNEAYLKGKELYYSGEYSAALDYLLTAAEGGHADAQYFAGLIYYLAYCGFLDYKKAAFWFKKAADQDHVFAEDQLANLYKTGKGVDLDYEKALYWYQCSAKHNNPDALYALGELYESGLGVSQEDEKAFGYYLKAASVGTSGYASTNRAIRKVASMYEYGIGVEQDTAASIKWLRKFLMLNDENDNSPTQRDCQEVRDKIEKLQS